MGAFLSKFWNNSNNYNNNHNIPKNTNVIQYKPPSRASSTSNGSNKSIHLSTNQGSSNQLENGNVKITTNDNLVSVENEKIKNENEQIDTKITNTENKEQTPVIYKTVLEAKICEPETVPETNYLNDKANENDHSFEIETNLLSPDVEDAIIKIQAGIRGYLARKQLRFSHEKNLQKQSSQQQIVPPPEKFSDNNAAIECPVDIKNEENNICLKQEDISQEIHLKEECQEKITFLPIEKSDKIEEINEQPAGEMINLQVPEVIETSFENADMAATKIQAAFRGYQIRKSISRENSPSRFKISKEKETNDKNESKNEEKEIPQKNDIFTNDSIESKVIQEFEEDTHITEVSENNDLKCEKDNLEISNKIEVENKETEEIKEQNETSEKNEVYMLQKGASTESDEIIEEKPKLIDFEEDDELIYKDEVKNIQRKDENELEKKTFETEIEKEQVELGNGKSNENIVKLEVENENDFNSLTDNDKEVIGKDEIIEEEENINKKEEDNLRKSVTESLESSIEQEKEGEEEEDENKGLKTEKEPIRHRSPNPSSKRRKKSRKSKGQGPH